MGFAWDYNSRVLFGRCTQTSLPSHPSSLIAHNSSPKMSFCSFVEKTHNPLLTNHCRFPSLQTANVWGALEYHGFKNPRLFALSGIASFRRHYLFTEKKKRLKDGNMNSRGLSSLRFIMSVYKWRLKDENRQRRLFKRYSLNAHCSLLIGQNLWSSVASVSSVCQSLPPTHSPLTVKYFYSCPQNAYWCHNEQKPLKIVQKQT